MGAFVGDPVYQFVTPRKFQNLVLHICHDNLTEHPEHQAKPTFSNSCGWADIWLLRGSVATFKAGLQLFADGYVQVTWYPAAYTLQNIVSGKSFHTIYFSVWNIKNDWLLSEILSDQGSNFMSHMIAEILHPLHINPTKAVAYHAQAQGALECFYQTLKSLLHYYCTELRGGWDYRLLWLLLAVREVVQGSMDFSPNYLVFGHKVQGLMAVLNASWEIPEPPQNLLDYFIGFRRTLVLAGERAQEKLIKPQHQTKPLYDWHAEPTQFQVGDQVFV